MRLMLPLAILYNIDKNKRLCKLPHSYQNNQSDIKFKYSHRQKREKPYHTNLCRLSNITFCWTIANLEAPFSVYQFRTDLSIQKHTVRCQASANSKRCKLNESAGMPRLISLLDDIELEHGFFTVLRDNDFKMA